MIDTKGKAWGVFMRLPVLTCCGCAKGEILTVI
jgi:hypothetical protein